MIHVAVLGLIVCYFSLQFLPPTTTWARWGLLLFSLTLPVVLAALLASAAWFVVARLRGGSQPTAMILMWAVGIPIYLVSSGVYRTIRAPGAGDSSPVSLAFGLHSHASPAEVRRMVGSERGPTTQWTDQYPSGWWGPCPPYEARELIFPEKRMLGTGGHLRTRFINDRLVRVAFHADDGAALRRTLEAARGLPDDPLGDRSSELRLVQGNRFLIWEDARLAATAENRFWFCLPRDRMFVP